jgi:hypothetical protein
VKARLGRTVFVLLVRPHAQDAGMHRISARVTFTTASASRPRTVRLVYERCASAAAVVRPQFTG